MAAAVSALSEWIVELNIIKAEIFDIYVRPGGAYNVFITAWNAPAPAPAGGLSRTRANPYPLTFYYDTHRLSELYASAVTLVCANGTYDNLIDVLAWLQNNCPESGRGLYFSNVILRNAAIAPEHRTKCAYAYIVGVMKDRFGHDVIEDADNGDVGVIHAKLVARVPELSCKALPILSAIRVVICPIKYGREARNASAIADSPWLALARTIVPAAAAMSTDDIVRSIISEELRQVGDDAWARRSAAVQAFAAARGW
jgi:hypothetical protein